MCSCFSSFFISCSSAVSTLRFSSSSWSLSFSALSYLFFLAYTRQHAEYKLSSWITWITGWQEDNRSSYQHRSIAWNNRTEHWPRLNTLYIIHCLATSVPIDRYNFNISGSMLTYLRLTGTKKKLFEMTLCIIMSDQSLWHNDSCWSQLTESEE